MECPLLWLAFRIVETPTLCYNSKSHVNKGYALRKYRLTFLRGMSGILLLQRALTYNQGLLLKATREPGPQGTGDKVD